MIVAGKRGQRRRSKRTTPILRTACSIASRSRRGVAIIIRKRGRCECTEWTRSAGGVEFRPEGGLAIVC